MKCTIEGCHREIRARGWCVTHYERWRQHGDTSITKKRPNGFFEEYIDKTLPSIADGECFNWPFQIYEDGYGHLTYKGKKTRPHIVACQYRNGPRPSGTHQAAHSCGNRACFNPFHIRWATPSENQQDRKAHGTYQYGTLNPSCKLTEDQVSEILSMKGLFLQREIASMYGVSRENVSAIHRGRSWKIRQPPSIPEVT